ncbi:HK97 gp10 family phage protein [Campylobacter fetus]|uniref:HK97-gp10 family putative phage morphogenesis protein n=1 Tax=Campylobacter fetus TaxID=196 RepID=UPI00122ECEA0|nr:HK97-gp10 family putative phage morphogenesis protein [Campylobacter fetus]KAA3687887.1 HK97 gp10 family phage protein [Campylobacter fetus subsp. fetus]QMS57979.1 HK97 gp10 family phage protein [Campylobacter fetus]
MNKIFKNFMFRVGAEVVNESKAIAPFKTGNLKKDIQVFKADQTSVTIGNSKLAPYAKFVHFGTKPHIIRVKKARVLANKKSGIIFGKKVNHPGTKANPYLKNALDSYIKGSGFTRAKSALANEVKNRIVNDIKKAVK